MALQQRLRVSQSYKSWRQNVLLQYCYPWTTALHHSCTALEKYRGLLEDDPESTLPSQCKTRIQKSMTLELLYCWIVLTSISLEEYIFKLPVLKKYLPLFQQNTFLDLQKKLLCWSIFRCVILMWHSHDKFGITHLLGQIANFWPAITRNSKVKGSTSLNDISQLHFGFQ